MAYSQSSSIPVIHTDADTRAGFLVRVYQHLALALVAFVAIETVLFMTGIASAIHDLLFRTGGVTWLLILGGFTVVSMISTRSAHVGASPSVQYAGLFALAGAEALIFAPFLYLAFNQEGGSTTVWSAAVVTAIGFGGLTLVAFTTRKDLSFLRPLILWGGLVAIGLIVAAVLFGFQLGIVFTIAMIGLAGASILYQTQNIVRHYPAWAYVGAAVSLFASLMMLFWYVLRLFMRR
jgi:FtsH-binding integral membrane protein